MLRGCSKSGLSGKLSDSQATRHDHEDSNSNRTCSRESIVLHGRHVADEGAEGFSRVRRGNRFSRWKSYVAKQHWSDCLLLPFTCGIDEYDDGLDALVFPIC
jgi:hypothetical protein